MMSEEHRKKIGKANSIAVKKYYSTHEVSKETRRKLSEAKKKAWNNPKSGLNTYERMNGNKNPFFGKHHSKESLDAISKKMSGEKHPNWKGGIYYQQDYIMINGEWQHRKVMEDKIGRKLLSTERVHHINGRKNDNRPENLRLFLNDSEHIKFHRAHPEIGMPVTD